jgi:hypothetical protein
MKQIHIEGLDCRKLGPLIRPRAKFIIDEDAGSLLARLFLQGQSDKVTEAARREAVLIRKETVVARKRKLPGPFAGMADEGSSESSRIAGQD